jgi:hypothetical protein
MGFLRQEVLNLHVIDNDLAQAAIVADLHTNRQFETKQRERFWYASCHRVVPSRLAHRKLDRFGS